MQRGVGHERVGWKEAFLGGGTDQGEGLAREVGGTGRSLLHCILSYPPFLGLLPAIQLARAEETHHVGKHRSKGLIISSPLTDLLITPPL